MEAGSEIYGAMLMVGMEREGGLVVTVIVVVVRDVRGRFG